MGFYASIIPAILAKIAVCGIKGIVTHISQSSQCRQKLGDIEPDRLPPKHAKVKPKKMPLKVTFPRSFIIMALIH